MQVGKRGNCLLPQNRFHRARLTLTRNLFPHQASTSALVSGLPHHHRIGQRSIEHMLLQPRSAPESTINLIDLRRLCFCPSFRAPLHAVRKILFRKRRRTIKVPKASASSIFGAVHFDRWVVTHSIAGSNLHGHRPILQSKRRPSEGSVDERESPLDS